MADTSIGATGESSGHLEFAARAEDIACALQEKLGIANAEQYGLMGHAAIAAAILEAVRALKPGTELGYALPDGWTSAAKVVADFEQLREAYTDARKHESIAHRAVEKALEEIRALKAEVDRLQAKVADHALTIGALRDENARLKVSCDSYIHVPVKEWADNSAELKRFREREELVERLLLACETSGALLKPMDKLVLDTHAAAVRDFGVIDNA